MRLVSFILPTLNEESIDASLDALTDHLAGIPGTRFEILIVDDSGHAQRKKLQDCVLARENLAPRIEIRLIEGAHRGKGSAVRLGALECRGDVVFVMDADLPVPLRHIEEFLKLLEPKDVEIVIGERPLDRNLGRPVRLLLSRVLYAFQYAIIFSSGPFGDTQCGFKAFRGDTLRSLAARQIVDGGMYDIEYLYMTRLDERKVVRVPVIPNPETRPSKIKVWKCLYTDPIDLLRVKTKGLTGGYAR